MSKYPLKDISTKRHTSWGWLEFFLGRIPNKRLSSAAGGCKVILRKIRAQVDAFGGIFGMIIL